MKRLVLLGLLLALLAAFPALASDLPVFALEENGTLIGSAVLFGTENTLLTSAPVSESAQLTLKTENGSMPVEFYSDHDGLLTILVSADPVPGTPLSIGQITQLGVKASGFLSDGSLSQSDCQHLAYTSNPEGVTLTAASGLLPGAVLTAEEGTLCGIIAASLGEGEGRYFALSSPEIYARLFEENEETEGEKIDYIEYTATVEKNRVTIDWSGSPQVKENAVYGVYWIDTANTYYTYHVCRTTSDTVACVPGRSYIFCVVEIPSEEEYFSLPEFPDYDPIQIPGGKKVERFNFLDTDVHLAALADGQTVGDTEIIPAITDYSTVFTHEGVHLYLQVTSTYQVTEESQTDLTCALFAPDGTCYASLSGFIFAPEYMPEDSWHMDVTELFDQCKNATGGQSGIYLLRYYLDDELASEFTFEVP